MKTIMKLNRSFYKRMFCYIAGLLIMSVGSNLFLKAALGVAPSCTIALALSEIFPSLSYAVFNFLVNSFLLLCEIAVVGKIEKRQAVQLVLTFLYSLFIQWTAGPLRFITADTMTARSSARSRYAPRRWISQTGRQTCISCFSNRYR